MTPTITRPLRITRRSRCAHPLLPLAFAAALTGCGSGVDAPATGQVDADARMKDVAPAPGQALDRIGQWSPLAPWPFIPIHSALTTDGRVLTYGSSPDGQQTGTFSYDVWDPGAGGLAAGHLTLPNTVGTDLFCSSQINLAQSNKMFMQGGDVYANGATTNRGNPDTNLFDPASNTLTPSAKMFRPRWYASAIMLTNGEIFIQGGLDGQDLAEVRQTSGTFRLLSAMPTSDLYWYYPRNVVAPDGRVFGYDTYGAAYFIDPAGTGKLTAAGWIDGQYMGDDASHAMFAPGRVLQFGGNSANSVVIDLNAPVVTQAPSGPLASQRRWVNGTLLADGSVLATGGSAVANELVDVNNAAEIWNPATGAWTVAAVGATARLYHATALLLPDASVLVGGGGAPGPLPQTNAEIYRPPYLFIGNAPAPRPTITAAPWVVKPGDTVPITVAASDVVARVTFVKAGSVTHSFNAEQRFVETAFTRTGNTVNAVLPGNGADLPPGYWMIFVLNAAGTPSVARLILVDPATAAPKAPWTAQRGGTGGATFRMDCPAGKVLAGVQGYADAQGVNQLQPRCVSTTAAGAWVGTPLATTTAGGPYGATFTRQCQANRAVSGFRGRANTIVRQLVLECKALNGRDTVTGSATSLAAVGSTTAGSAFTSTACPDATRAVDGLFGRAGASIDAVAARCTRGLYTPGS